MKIINLRRGQGKTTRLLYASEFNNIPILCATRNHKEYLIEMAKQFRLNIPEPICVGEIKTRPTIVDKDILIDEVPIVIEALLSSMGIRVNIKAITLTSDELK